MRQENARTLRKKMAGSRHSKFVRGKNSELESIIVSFLCTGVPFGDGEMAQWVRELAVQD